MPPQASHIYATANTFNVSKSVISRLWNRYQQTQNVDDQPRSGRPRATTGVQVRLIRNQAPRNRAQTANQIVANLHQATGVRVTSQTIRNRLRAAHLQARPYRVVPTLTNHYIVYRREWCRERQNWVFIAGHIRRVPIHFGLNLDRRGRVWGRQQHNAIS